MLLVFCDARVACRKHYDHEEKDEKYRAKADMQPDNSADERKHKVEVADAGVTYASPAQTILELNRQVSSSFLNMQNMNTHFDAGESLRLQA